MLKDMLQWAEIRRRVLVDGVSKRQILRETGMHWTTLEKILQHSEPPGYRTDTPRAKPKLGPYLDRIAQILEDDRQAPRSSGTHRQRIYQRLRDEGYQGGYTVIKEVVRDLRLKGREVFVPLVHRPEAQVDFGEAVIKAAGQLRKVAFLVMALPHSDAFFVRAYDRECTETFWDGHVRPSTSSAACPADHLRQQPRDGRGSSGPTRLTRGFLQLESHYLFDHHFCRVERPNEKGIVEGTVKFARLNFLVPVPQVRDLDELNAHLLGRCREDLDRRLRGHAATKRVLLEEDRAAFLPLPAAPFDACRKESTTANSLSLVRFDDNDYSVPLGPPPDRGAGLRRPRRPLPPGREEVAEHRRLWVREGVSYDPVHYLALLERKPGADFARPLQGWELPGCFEVLRRAAWRPSATATGRASSSASCCCWSGTRWTG